MKPTSVCLQLDVGNSSAKWRLVKNADVIKRGRYRRDDPASLEQLLDCTTRLDQIWISSVATSEAEDDLVRRLRDHWGVQPWLARTQARTGDLRNSYAEPGRMGVDRWLAMLGARRRCVKRLCVVDAGSALTIDLVAADGRHEGGYIIPGPALMERALLLDTGRVRFEGGVEYALAPGRSTAEAVRHGVAVSQVGALESVLAQQGLSGSEGLFFCGGGAEVLMQLAGCGGTHAPDLVFEGLEVMATSRAAGD